MRKHRLGKQLLIVLCVLLIVFLAGCRPSPVLEQIIYEQNHEVNPDTETKTMDDDPENEEPDENIPPRETEEDAEQEKDQEYTAALAGDSDTDPDAPLDAVYDVVYSPSGELSAPVETNPKEGSTSEKATGSTESGGEEAGNESVGEGEEPGSEGASADEAQGGESAGEEQTGGGNGDDMEGDSTAGEGLDDTGEPAEKQIIDDDNGEEVEPVSGSRVTAVGEAAAIVEMLGGRGQLVGSSSSFTGDSFAQQVFASEGISDVATWWDGDGSSTISEGNFQALLEAHPDVCFEISGQDTFSEAQIAALNEAGIAYTVIPQLNSIENIKSAVTIVGEVLGDHSSEDGTNAEQIASDYCAWADRMVGMAGGSTKYTAYIGRWAADDYWEIYSTSGILMSGYGLPVGTNSNTGTLNDCMNAANVVNESANNHYVEPLYTLYWGPRIENQTAKYNRNVFTIRTPETKDIALGTADYPAVIVADSSILQDMLNGSGNYFYYHWTPGTQYYTGTTWEFGFDDLIGDSQRVTTYIRGAYYIHVNPSGVGNWASGSVESPLEAVWLSCMFQGNISMSDVENEVRNFYSTFYHYDGVDTSRIFPSSYHVEVPQD